MQMIAQSIQYLIIPGTTFPNTFTIKPLRIVQRTIFIRGLIVICQPWHRASSMFRVQNLGVGSGDIPVN
ncbi:hypothetical protein A247_27841 [Pseudomonas syringae pv. actinidiae ICMP 19099]|nr:hypothetical protein A246_27449 [Pseudomonas syringae pv. actinidiae ICMP 19098]EPN14030.1 hypothetical protein A248_28206 [Pseudomonas syringae pv. actinidiae ICMP 19100]EPN22609.1 hypothetical protein A247_27841 [Pseudomonas syringae pv. actinidiae ICMP 19099]EPN30077.1 hypothetical protein A243_28602 [Pseudomonas syringae pv. actinidiae ICMP 18883]EPN47254.1 hypothetical protein A241_28606 [Pseudomonas syringae pv. actinidiae ICMP 19094]OOK93281.1 hypothetical protein B0B36_28700 [Pseudo